MNQHVKDDGDLRRYFSQIPHLADDELDPYEMRLYVHYKRVCGQRGKCWEGRAATAKACRMSEGMVTKTRNRLAKGGWIKLERGGAQNDTYHITIIDRWHENMSKYNGSSCGDDGSHTVPTGRHVVTQRITKEEEPKENDTTEAPASDKQPAAVTESVTKATTRKPDPLFDAIADNWHTAPGQTALLKSLMMGTNKKYTDCNFSPPAAPDEVSAFVEWYGRKYPNINLPVAPEKLQSHFYAFRKSPATSKEPETRWNNATQTREQKIGGVWYRIATPPGVAS